MAFQDLREFIKKLEETGDVVKIEEEVDWNLEAGAIARRCNELNAPAQLFQKVKGYPEGYRLFQGILATYRRLAIAMEMDPDTSYGDLLKEYMDRKKNPIKPILVSDGPCKENIIIGEDVDLYKFPVPVVHGGEPRFIGTSNAGTCRDPDSDWTNWGTHRIQVQDKNTTTIALIIAHHGGMIYRKYEERERPMEYAAFIGNEPTVHLIGTAGIPYGVSEVDIIGGIRREPLPLVKCETVDLMVPATAEIVIEGEIPPHERKPDGPFGEYPGYSVGGIGDRPVFKIKAITHRNDPILTFACIGIPTDEYGLAGLFCMAADLKTFLLEAGLPIVQVYVPPEGCAHLCVVSTKTPYPHVASRIAGAVWAHEHGGGMPRVIVVNDDVDPSNMKEVIHALATKCHPVNGTIVMEHNYNFPWVPFLDPEKRSTSFDDPGGRGSSVVYDCTWPLHWKQEGVPIRSSFRDIYPKEIQERVLKNWKKYGFNSGA